MPPVIFAPGAIRDLQRLRQFLRAKSPAAAKRAGEVIVQSVQILAHQPRIGRPVEGLPEGFREWIIDFGDSGYVAQYRVAADTDAVTILALRHQKEQGYRG